MSSPVSGVSEALSAIQSAIIDFVTGAAYVFDGIAQFFVQHAAEIGAILAGVGLAMFFADRFGLIDILKGLVRSVVPH